MKIGKKWRQLFTWLLPSWQDCKNWKKMKELNLLQNIKLFWMNCQLDSKIIFWFWKMKMKNCLNWQRWFWINFNQTDSSNIHKLYDKWWYIKIYFEVCTNITYDKQRFRRDQNCKQYQTRVGKTRRWIICVVWCSSSWLLLQKYQAHFRYSCKYERIKIDSAKTRWKSHREQLSCQGK